MKTIQKAHSSWIKEQPAYVWVLGAKGLLGRELLSFYRTSAPGVRVRGLTRAECDFKEKSLEQLLQQGKPDLIINAAAYTQVDAAESERDQNFFMNASVPRRVSELCRREGIQFFHYGSEQVFSGRQNGPWKESDLAFPLNAYGLAKLEGDREVIHNGGTVLRVQWLYSRHRDRFDESLSQEGFRPFSDQFGCPTWARDVCAVTAGLVAKRAKGLFHFAYDNSVSWAEAHRKAHQMRGMSLSFQEQTLQEADLPAKRTEWGFLGNSKVKAELGLESLGNWEDAYLRFLREEGRA